MLSPTWKVGSGSPLGSSDTDSPCLDTGYDDSVKKSALLTHTHIAAEQFYGTKLGVKIVVLEVLDVGLYNFIFEWSQIFVAPTTKLDHCFFCVYVDWKTWEIQIQKSITTSRLSTWHFHWIKGDEWCWLREVELLLVLVVERLDLKF